MKVFISFSGPASKAVAIALKPWLRRLIPGAEPWVATDITKGARWSREVALALEVADYGLVCLTPENLSEPWILYEAGAIAKAFDARACTVLLGLRKSDVRDPLGQFQHTELRDRDDMLRLATDLNNSSRVLGHPASKDEDLIHLFNLLWPELEKEIAVAEAMQSPHPESVPTLSIAEESLAILREIRSKLGTFVTTPAANAQERHRRKYATTSIYNWQAIHKIACSFLLEEDYIRVTTPVDYPTHQQMRELSDMLEPAGYVTTFTLRDPGDRNDATAAIESCGEAGV